MVESRRQAELIASGIVPGEGVLEQVGMQLLETLDALSTVYESAEYFAGVIGDGPIASYTLERCMEAVGSELGVFYLDEGGELSLRAERGEAAPLLRPEAVERLASGDRTVFRNAPAAVDCLAPEAADRSLLCAPIVASGQRLGVVALLCEPSEQFTTKDVKLVGAVTSQVAIALSSALHYREVEIERSKLRSVIEDNSEGIVVLDPEGRTVLCNSEARRLLGIPQEETRGTDFLGKLSEWESVAGAQAQAWAGREGSTEISRGQGMNQRVISIRSTEVCGAAHETVNVILTLHDLTEERREEWLKQDFLSLISHKFRTPITGILGGLMMLRDESGEDRDEILEETNRRADELAALVDRLLYFAEVMKGSWSTRGRSDLTRLRDELHLQMMERHGEINVSLEWEIAEDARIVQLPESRLYVVLENLIDNAIRFSPGKPEVRVTANQGGYGSVLVRVEDRGPGIAEADRARALQSFTQRDDEFTGNEGGVGIGLALVTEIVRRVGGGILIDDAEPHGTVVTLTLPGVEEDGEAES